MSYPPPYPSGDQPSSPYGAGPYANSPYGNPPPGNAGYGNAPYGPEGIHQQPGNPAGGYPSAYPQVGYGGGFQPPQRKSKAPLVVGIVAAVLVLMVLGGVGGFFLLKDDDDSADNTSSEQTTSDEESSKQDTDGESTSAGKLVQPEGAPYSYRVPAGFVQEKASPDDDRYETNLSLAEGGDEDIGITVNVVEGKPSNVTEFEDELASALKAGGLTITSSSRIQINDKEALRFDVTEGPMIGTFSYVSATGGKIVYIGCGATSAIEETVKKGCQQVLDSMKIE